MSVLIYTAVVGDYPIKRDDIQCFNGERLFERPVMDAKRYKVLPHLYFPDCAITVWVDANVWLLADPQATAERFLGDADMALFVHPARKTVWQEFAELRNGKRFQIPYLQAQLALQEAAYRDAGLPEQTALHECNFLIRRNNDPVNRLMDAWWSEICRWQWRDQVSMPYVLWKYGAGVKVRPITDGDIRKHPDFRYVKHYA